MSADFFADFADSSYEDWLAALRESLAGGDLDELVKQMPEGIDIHPLPRPIDVAHGMPGAFPYMRGTSANAKPWLVAQEIAIDDPREFNAALRDALANGQTAIVLGDRPHLQTEADVRIALDGIDLARFPIYADDAGILPLLQAIRGADEIRQLRGCIGMASGDYDEMAERLRMVEAASPNLGCVNISAAALRDDGADAVRELAHVLTTGAAVMRGLMERGLSAGAVAKRLHVTLGIGGDFFMQVAKLRAVKSLWARMTRGCGAVGEARKIRLRAQCDMRDMPANSAHKNLLRQTVAALAAAIGGVDSLTLADYDGREDDGLSRRITRNIQLILLLEAQVSRHIDAAGGSWHVERLTDELAKRAWAAFATPLGPPVGSGGGIRNNPVSS